MYGNKRTVIQLINEAITLHCSTRVAFHRFEIMKQTILADAFTKQNVSEITLACKHAVSCMS